MQQPNHFDEVRQLTLLLAILLFGCQQQKKIKVTEETVSSIALGSLGNETLSSYGFFVGPLQNLQPAENVFMYEINSPLFSDYAWKKRFIKLPAGQPIKYVNDDVFDFPNGTVLIKNFYYPSDFRHPDKDLQILETRLLLKDSGEWRALPYIWNDEQTEAYLDVAGKNIDVSWIHDDGSSRQVLYSVPNLNQCSGCHVRGEKTMPIGPTARQLNHGNQLPDWSSRNFLAGLPDVNVVPKLVSYTDPEASVDLRARAWLEVNCAHCHRPDGAGKTSGLHLMADVQNPFELGIGKAPVAAGRGSGGLKFDIVPGHPDESILFYRIQSADPGVMMPELGKKLVHDEGIELVRQWISNLNP